MSRVAFGFIVSPVLAVVIVGCLLAFFSRDPQARLWDPGTVFMFSVIGLPVAYASTLLFGVPAFVVSSRRAWLANWQVALAGVICSMPAGLIAIGGGMTLLGSLWWMAVCIICGGIAGIAFWFLACRENPTLTLQSTRVLARDALLPVKKVGDLKR